MEYARCIFFYIRAVILILLNKTKVDNRSVSVFPTNSDNSDSMCCQKKKS